MRLPQQLLAPALVFTTLILATGAGASPYDDELRRQCPANHLENMTAGDLEHLMEGFETRLTPAQKRQQQDAVGARCARIEAGLSCANGATLDTYRRLGLLKDFVRQACDSGWACKGFADCVQARP
jgi:hypothetical protein